MVIQDFGLKRVSKVNWIRFFSGSGSSLVFRILVGFRWNWIQLVFFGSGCLVFFQDQDLVWFSLDLDLGFFRDTVGCFKDFGSIWFFQDLKKGS